MGPCYPSCRTTSHPASMVQLPPTRSPPPGRALESQLSSQPRVGLRRNPNHPPHILIQEAPSSLGASSARCRRSPSMPFPSRISRTSICSGASKCRSELLIRTTAMQITTPRSPSAIRRGDGTASTGSRYSSPSASPIIGVGRAIEGYGSPLGHRGRRRWRTRAPTAPATGVGVGIATQVEKYLRQTIKRRISMMR
ncbi:hypothetical protein FIBSPDRAFT_261736 [Athelia psychrophila]|uniref:Uncharacterized protein n=1 Tax=Athelia psychrophila TaxID=1759441 RepID=A0A165XH62_9AGAM|nr:hypothetical protein FIBSPDRAFT_261736 [Fibularhizoctonia sp. CBS 109695]